MQKRIELKFLSDKIFTSSGVEVAADVEKRKIVNGEWEKPLNVNC